MILVILAAGLTILSATPPLPPAQAVAVLRGSHSPQDLTDYRAAPPPALPQVVFVPSPPRPAPAPSPSRPSFNNFVNGYPVNSIDDVREAITRARLRDGLRSEGSRK